MKLHIFKKYISMAMVKDSTDYWFTIRINDTIGPIQDHGLKSLLSKIIVAK